MLKIIALCVDLLFPPRPTELHVRSFQGNGKANYVPHTYAGVIFLSDYQTPLIQALIKENKYHHNRRAAIMLGDLLSLWLTSLPQTPTFIVPIPQSKKRAQERGYNQVEAFLQAISLPPHIQVHTTILKKTKHTDTQTNLQRDARMRNVEDSFSCTHDDIRNVPSGSTVVIVDDVVTTGATLKAARGFFSPPPPQKNQLFSLHWHTRVNLY
jgi:ComF family protein